VVVHHAYLWIGVIGCLNCPPLTASIHDLDQAGIMVILDILATADTNLLSVPPEEAT
jgi:hypothetical protein